VRRPHSPPAGWLLNPTPSGGPIDERGASIARRLQWPFDDSGFSGLPGSCARDPVRLSLLHLLLDHAPTRNPWRGGRKALAAALFLLLAGAIVSVFLQRRVDSALARAKAGTFQLSAGFGLMLALAFFLAWAVWVSSRIWSPQLHSAPFGWSAILPAVVFSAYGVWNATHPRAAAACQACYRPFQMHGYR